MKLFPVHSLLWSCLLVVWASQNGAEANTPDVCQDEKSPGEIIASEDGHTVQEKAVTGNFLCRLYPTNILNCSWSLDTLPKDAHLLVNMSICDDDTTVNSLSSEEKVGSRSLTQEADDMLYVILQFDITLHDTRTVYTYTYEMEMLETLSPPPNISASVKDGNLSVTWDVPLSRVTDNPSCFEYELDMGDQETPRHINGKLVYTEQNADLSRTYRVRMRTRIADHCHDKSKWSEWSHTVSLLPEVEPPSQLNTLVIVSISLGIPMILLAVLLLLRYQSLSKVLFPPIPGPSQKYIYILEKNDTFNVFHPAPKPEPVEEITEVEDTEQIPGQTS